MGAFSDGFVYLYAYLSCQLQAWVYIHRLNLSTQLTCIVMEEDKRRQTGEQVMMVNGTTER